MRHNKNIAFVVLIFATTSSCYQDVNMEQYRKEPIGVLNCIVGPDTVVMSKVGHTVFFTDHRDTDLNVANASVRLAVNGVPMGELQYHGKTGFYMSQYRPKSGDVICVTADTDYGMLKGECTVPDCTPIISVDVKGRIFEDKDSYIYDSAGERYGYSYEVIYSIKFVDTRERRDFYCVRIENQNGHPAETIDYSTDEVFVSQQTSVDAMQTSIYGNEGRTFTDEIFDGSEYTLRIKEKNDWNSVNTPRIRKVILYTLSEDYYKYLTDVLNEDEESLADGLVDFGFVEPVAIFSNVNGGTGIVGAVQHSEVSIDINKCLKY